MSPKITTYNKICILRLSAIGDVTHVLPLINTIKKQQPDAEITWVCGHFEYKLLHIIPGIRFVVFDKKQGIRAYFKLWKTLKAERFDVLLHMQVAARANIASLGIKANIRIGWDKPRSRDFHQLFINKRVDEAKQQHQVDAFLSFAKAMGLIVNEPEWNIPITKSARQFVEKTIDKNKPVLIISACSSHTLRNWFAGRYACLADYATNHYGMQVVLSGGPSPLEMKMANEIETIMQNKPLNLVGKDTLEQLAGLLNSARVVLSPDTGPAHLANAMGVPVIGLYACTWSKRSGPYHSLHYCVDKFDEAANKYLHKSANELHWGAKIEKPGVMELITVDEVCHQLDNVMSAVSK